MNADEQEKHQEFNAVLLEAIDESIRELLGPTVLKSLYTALKNQYDVTRDELPYRLETAYKILHGAFGIEGSRTISRKIARRLHQKLNLGFEDIPSIGLIEYVEIAKRKLARR